MESQSPEKQPTSAIFPLSRESINRSFEKMSKNPENTYRQAWLHLSEYHPELGAVISNLENGFGIDRDCRGDLFDGVADMYSILTDQAEERGGDLPILEEGVRKKILRDYISSVDKHGKYTDLVAVLKERISKDDPEVIKALEELSRYRSAKDIYSLGYLTVYTAFRGRHVSIGSLD